MTSDSSIDEARIDVRRSRNSIQVEQLQPIRRNSETGEMTYDSQPIELSDLSTDGFAEYEVESSFETEPTQEQEEGEGGGKTAYYIYISTYNNEIGEGCHHEHKKGKNIFANDWLTLRGSAFDLDEGMIVFGKNNKASFTWFIDKIKIGAVQFPVKIKDIAKVEELNNEQGLNFCFSVVC